MVARTRQNQTSYFINRKVIMPLSWNEIKTRALAFTKEWKNETSEDAEAKSFWDDFFNVFGISRRRVASFEKSVKKLDSKQGFIDLLWKGVILVEHKSRGRDLDKALQQAKDYFPGLKEHELPRYLLVSDFARFRLYDLDQDTTVEFALPDFVQHVHHFGFIAGYEKRTYKEEDPVNLEAALKMGKLHDRLEEVGYRGHDLEVYLVRLLFCLFADDTNIFEKGIFQEYIDLHTKPDGSDLAMHLATIFQVLNTPREQRFSNLDEALAQFPYVNGKLFEENLPLAAFDSKMREMLLEACGLNWSKISPAIFGSMFQAVMNPQERRNLGAHYTSEKNILKLIKPLFLDALQAEFTKAKGNKNKLNELHKKLSGLRFLDPACGCGNFLIITYRELRLLEIDILRELYGKQQVTGIDAIINLDVDQFYGIEIDEFAVRIAEVALWLMDHQMNQRVSEEFGLYFARLPLRKSATIVHGNALRIDWGSLLNKDRTVNVYAKEANIIATTPQVQEPDLHYGKVNVYADKVTLLDKAPDEKIPDLNFDYIMGNPPFLGHHYQNIVQKGDMGYVFTNVNGYGVLDYVSAWYIKAAQFIKGTSICCAFVSTNSISQGEQVGILWQELFKYQIKIHFAHRTFNWTNEARGKAAVHVVIIGFANFDAAEKYIYEYQNIKGEPHQIKVKNINPYLVDAKDLIVGNRREPISNVPKMIWGNKPTDGGNFLFENSEEKEAFLAKEPNALAWIRPFLSGENFIHGKTRWCLWLTEISPKELRGLREVLKRVELVKQFRLNSKAEATRKKAMIPSLFAQIAQPKTNYLAIPEVSSERRTYIPIGFLTPDIIASNTIQLIPNSTLWHFGILTSQMHMTWVKYVCGRLKSDFRYSNSIVYNNYPFPQQVSEAQRKRVEEAAQAVLDVRASFPNNSLADLYDPRTMPPALLKVHQALDKAVDACYRSQPFANELNRIEFLFNLYEQYTQPLLATNPPKRKNTKG